MHFLKQSIFLCLLMLVGMGMHAEEIPNNEIWYTSSDGEVVTPYDSEKFGATIISNTYSGGKGVIKLNKSVTSIGDWVFYNSSLTSVTIPNSVTSIGNYAFYNCKSLASVTIPNSVTSIGKWAFGDCSGLASITIPNSVKSIGEKAFYNCIVSSFVNNSSLNAIANKYWEAKICEKSGLIIEDNVVVDCAVWATSISIPNSVKSIGDYAFAICTNLTSIDIPNSVKSIGDYAFNQCTGLTSVAIPNSVTSIGNFAFWGCTNLISVSIPNSVTSIGNNAFQLCTSLSSFKVNWTTPLSIKSGTFKDVELSGCTLYVPKGTSELYKSDAVWGMFGEIAEFTPNNVITYEATKKLDEVTVNYQHGLHTDAFNASIVSHEFKDGKGTIIFDADVTSIGESAFYFCSDLTSIDIPNSVTSIGLDAFWGCSGLTSITMPNSVTSIGECAFGSCSGLTSITVESGNPNYDSRDNCNAIIETATNTLIAGCMNTVIPNSVTGIGYWAFGYCSGLTSINIPNSVTSIGDYAFYSCSSLASVNIPESVTSIGEDAFARCPSLTSINIPESVTSIGNYAFYYCSSLASVNIPESVTSIGKNAFAGCSSLTSINIPESVTSIGENAFAGCSSLSSFEVNWTTPLSINSNTFDYVDLSECTLIVPKGTSELYKADAVWGMFGEIAEFTHNNVITYEAREKLTEVTVANADGLHTDAFNASIVSHEFKDGKGTITFDADVTSIGYAAFKGCTGLTSITIPNSVTSIGYGAFFECSGLTSITIPNSVTSIGDWVFGYCSLTSVTIPNSVTSIGISAFKGCTGLTSITVESGNPNYDSRDNCNALIETSTNKLIAGCNSTVIPNSITSIGDGAFQYCSGLTSITIPNSVTSIGDWAFYECSGLTSITIPNSVTSIGDWAFGYCSGLTSITIPNSVTSIGWATFSDCSGLTSINIPNSVTSIEKEAFQYCTGLTSITIPNSVTSIGSYVFFSCTGLTSIEIPSSVTSIGNSAFWNCSSLTSINIPESVTSIGDYAFQNCTSLASINIPESVTSIGGYAFGYCASLTSFEVNWTTPLSIKSDTFEDVELSGCTLYVPQGTSELYKADAVWGKFGEIKENSENAIRNTATSYSDIKVYTSGNTITITGVSADEPVAVYNSNGVRVAFGTGNCSIQVNGNGVYYIRIEGRTFKICM